MAPSTHIGFVLLPHAFFFSILLSLSGAHHPHCLLRPVGACAVVWRELGVVPISKLQALQGGSTNIRIGATHPVCAFEPFATHPSASASASGSRRTVPKLLLLGTSCRSPHANHSKGTLEYPLDISIRWFRTAHADHSCSPPSCSNSGGCRSPQPSPSRPHPTRSESCHWMRKMQ